MSWVYLAAIVGSTLGVGVLDRRWRLFLFDRPLRAIAVVAAGVVFFVTWDLVAIGLGIYQRGESPAMTGIELARDLPLEELFFIVFLSYLTMVLHGLVALALTSPRARRPPSSGSRSAGAPSTVREEVGR